MRAAQAPFDLIVWGDYLGGGPYSMDDWKGGPRWVRQQGFGGRMVAASDNSQIRQYQMDDGCDINADFWESKEDGYEISAKQVVPIAMESALSWETTETAVPDGIIW